MPPQFGQCFGSPFVLNESKQLQCGHLAFIKPNTKPAIIINIPIINVGWMLFIPNLIFEIKAKIAPKTHIKLARYLHWLGFKKFFIIYLIFLYIRHWEKIRKFRIFCFINPYPSKTQYFFQSNLLMCPNPVPDCGNRTLNKSV